jgi:type I restriction enzyme S subunit
MEHLGSGVPVLRGEHLERNLKISDDWSEYWFVSDEVSAQYPKTLCEIGDLIMSVRGTIGKVGIVDKPLAGCQVSPNCLRIAPLRNVVLPTYLGLFLQSGAGQASLLKQTSPTTINTIKAGLFITTAVPIPSIQEQTVIVDEVARLQSAADHLGGEVDSAIAGATRLGRATLGAAFSGQLVAQDPNDEPASVLLQRVGSDSSVAMKRSSKSRKFA